MSPSPACKELIQQFEGCRLEAYLCPANIPTIGYGHTVGVKAGDVWTQDEADRVLELDLQEYGRAVSRLLKVPVTQTQFDALVSLAFNIGTGAFGKSTLLKMVNLGDSSAAREFLKWTKAGGKILPGLVKRRAAERALFERAA